jgi:hypothetical protein
VRCVSTLAWVGFASVSLDFGSEAGDFRAQIIEFGLHVSAGRASGGRSPLGGGSFGLAGPIERILDKLTEVFALLSIKFAKLAQPVSGRSFDLFVEDFGDRSTNEKGMNKRVAHETRGGNVGMLRIQKALISRVAATAQHYNALIWWRAVR